MRVYSEQNLDDVLDLFDDLGSFLREGDNMKYLPVFDSIIDDSGNNMNHMVRIAAPYAFYPIDINTGKPLKKNKEIISWLKEKRG